MQPVKAKSKQKNSILYFKKKIAFQKENHMKIFMFYFTNKV